MTIYEGYDLLDLTEPNRLGPYDETIERRLVTLDGKSGAITVDPLALLPRPVRPFRWISSSRAEATAMRTFLEARAGRAIPFWMPTYEADFVLASPMNFATATATIQWIGYFERVWGKDEGRRHIALFAPTTGLSYHAVTWSAHTAGAATEDLTLDPSAPVNYPTGTIGMFLKFCRLDSDAIEMRWRGEVAEAELVARELPHEEPIPPPSEGPPP